MWWLLMLVSFPLQAMDIEKGRPSRHKTIRHRAHTEDDIQEITEIIMGYYFNEAEPCVKNKIEPKVRREIAILKDQHEQEVYRKLEHMRHKLHSARVRSADMHHEMADMRRHLAKVVSDALKEEFDELDTELTLLKDELQKENKRKWAALICGGISTLIAGTIPLIIHFSTVEK